MAYIFPYKYLHFINMLMGVNKDNKGNTKTLEHCGIRTKNSFQVVSRFNCLQMREDSSTTAK